MLIILFFIFIIFSIVLYFYYSQSEIRILNLILYSETNEEYKRMYKILSRYLKKINVNYYFYCYKENLKKEYEIVDDIIYIKGTESLVPGCLDKTLKVFSICKNLDFDYVVRSNISEVINFKLLKKYLETVKVKYGGATLLNLSWYDPPSGIIDQRYWNTYFIRGNAIIFDKEVFELIESNRNEILGYNVVDDVAFGIFLKNKINDIYFTDEKTNVNRVYDDVIFYRNKSYNRQDDLLNMEKITENFNIT